MSDQFRFMVRAPQPFRYRPEACGTAILKKRAFPLGFRTMCLRELQNIQRRRMLAKRLAPACRPLSEHVFYRGTSMSEIVSEWQRGNAMPGENRASMLY